MATWISKFQEVVLRHLPTPEDGDVVANEKNFLGKKRVIFYGVGKPIPAKMIDDIFREVFPLIEGAKMISPRVLSLEYLVDQDRGWKTHCACMNMGS